MPHLYDLYMFDRQMRCTQSVACSLFVFDICNLNSLCIYVQFCLGLVCLVSYFVWIHFNLVALLGAVMQLITIFSEYSLDKNYKNQRVLI